MHYVTLVVESVYTKTLIYKTLVFVTFLFCSNIHAQLPDYSRIVSEVTQCVVYISAVVDDDDSHPFTTSIEFSNSEENLSQLSEDVTLENIDHLHNGSGITYSEYGHIITNNHIVQGASQILVRFSNGLTFNASIIATSPQSDIAVLSIDYDTIPLCKMSDNEYEINAGQYILGFGSPYSLSGSVTEGIISFVNRPLPIMGVYSNDILYIQTDLEIAPGNSGGPIVNLNGEIIGINSLLLSSSSNTANIAFAIPFKLVKRIADDLINQGVATKGNIGVNVIELPSDIETVRALGLQTPTGALISYVEEGSVAERAGVLVGDIVVSVNHTVIKNHYEFNYEIALRREGEIIRLVIIRDGRYFSTNAIAAAVIIE